MIRNVGGLGRSGNINRTISTIVDRDDLTLMKIRSRVFCLQFSLDRRLAFSDEKSRATLVAYSNSSRLNGSSQHISKIQNIRYIPTMLICLHAKLGDRSGGGARGEQNILATTVAPNLQDILVIACFVGRKFDWDRKRLSRGDGAPDGRKIGGGESFANLADCTKCDIGIYNRRVGVIGVPVSGDGKRLFPDIGHDK